MRLKTAATYLLLGLMSGGLAACGAASDNNGTLSSASSVQSNKSSTYAHKESGLMLDTARHFYSVNVIKNFIDTLAASGGSFLHLHFSDHENYALESDLLGQKAENATRRKDGVYINPQTGKPFLSYRQLKELARYAQSKNIELIPEVGSPNHMDGIFQLMTNKYGQGYVDSLKSAQVDDEIDINKPESIEFMKKLMAEVADVFGSQSKHFHMGGDEFGYSEENNQEFIDYINKLAAYLEQKGLTPRMWNDGLITKTVDGLDHNIQITYWSYDGDTENRAAAARRRQMRASMPDLINKGFTVLNYNSYYLYLVPKEGDNFGHQADFAGKDIEKRWNLGVWDGENLNNAVRNTDNILGAALAIWGEDAGRLSDKSIQEHSSGTLKAVIRKIRADDQAVEQ
ncbi:family 20 glycosylhydrolase [Neisseria montereyensis]|uniref:family 20 glycosylhydrolase n=1 Tax=Neisseria montereyensis TaxID=2973938 RepID=UPI0025A384A0|nr:family 20 glycosylhydrolase [Neisseria montereyensis]